MRAYAELAVQSQLEYRINALSDWCLNPLISTIVELAMWWTLFEAMGVRTLGGFSREYYLSYVTWAVFFSRITANWMYEFRMIQEVDSGTINAILVRPVSFYEFYLGQFLGYKVFTAIFSLWLPAILSFFIGGSTDLSRMPLALALVFCYLVFTYTLTFCLVTFGFHLTKISSFTFTKNLFLWMASGELFPMDLLPPALRQVTSFLPFSSGCYIPVGYLTHRIESEQILKAIVVTLVWTMVLGAAAVGLWRRGLRAYAGTGA